MTDTRSLQQIKRETEQTRAGLTDTVEQLRASVADTASDIRQRISPDHIKAEVSQYIKSRGEQLVEDITAAARRNPIQAVAVGASLGYPLLRMARAIPLPIVMVGAGLFLAGSKTGRDATQKASDMAADLAGEAQRRARDLRDQVDDATASARSYASDNLNRLRAGVVGASDQASLAADRTGYAVAAGADQLRDRASSVGASAADQAYALKDRAMGAVGSASEQANALKDKAMGAVGSAADQASALKDKAMGAVGSATSRLQNAASAAQDIASDATSEARRMMGNTVDAGMSAVRTARDTAAELPAKAGKTVVETIEQHPLIVAGVGLLVGGLIASALPRSQIEAGAIGAASTAVKRRAQAAAAQGIDAAKEAVGEVYDQTMRQAQAEGLTPDALGKTAEKIGEKLRHVAESAVTTAFEPQNQLQQNTNGVRDHG
jgi:hypothetical protein